MAELLAEADLPYELVDIDQSPELLSRFSEVVPVLLRDGKPVAKVRLNRSQLLRLVRRSRAG